MFFAIHSRETTQSTESCHGDLVMHDPVFYEYSSQSLQVLYDDKFAVVHLAENRQTVRIQVVDFVVSMIPTRIESGLVFTAILLGANNYGVIVAVDEMQF